MTEKQENAIRSALSVDRGSVHFSTFDFDVAYINYGDKVLVQFCSHETGRKTEEQLRGTKDDWVTPDKVIEEVDRVALSTNFFRVCWHKQHGDMKCNRIA